MFRVARRAPEERDTAEVALTATKFDGTKATLYAKLDSGSDVNCINKSTVEALLGESAHKHMRHLTAEEKFSFLAGKEWTATHSINLDFTAGSSRRAFHRINFIVVEDDPETANIDGLPNVLLGLPLLMENSMLMIDVDYCNEPDPKLPVLASKASTETGGIHIPDILNIKKLPKTVGVKR